MTAQSSAEVAFLEGQEIVVADWPGARGKVFRVSAVRAEMGTIDALDAEGKLRTFPLERCRIAGAPAPEATSEETLAETDGQLLMLGVEEIALPQDNPRRVLGDLDELAASILAVGILEPLVVAPAAEGTAAVEGFVLVAGSRRLAAAKAVGLKHVPSIVWPLDDEQRQEAMLIENLQRLDLTPLEEARAYWRLLEMPDYTQRKLAERIGRSQAHVSKRLALLALPPVAVQALDSGRITIEQGLELTKIAEHPEVIEEVLAVPEDDEELAAEPVDSWEIQAAIREVERKQKLAARRAELEASGITILESPKGTRLGKYGPLEHVDAKKHAKEPCHAIYLGPYGNEEKLCTRPKRHPKPTDAPKAKADPKAEAESARRQAFADAAERRLAFLQELCRKRTVPKGADELIAWALVSGEDIWTDAEICRRLLGDVAAKVTLAEWVRDHPEDLRRAGFTVIASWFEAGIDAYGCALETNRWFAFLEQHGYALDGVERELLEIEA